MADGFEVNDSIPSSRVRSFQETRDRTIQNRKEYKRMRLQRDIRKYFEKKYSLSLEEKQQKILEKIEQELQQQKDSTEVILEKRKFDKKS